MEVTQKYKVQGGSSFINEVFSSLANFKPTVSCEKYYGLSFRLIKRLKQ